MESQSTPNSAPDIEPTQVSVSTESQPTPDLAQFIEFNNIDFYNIGDRLTFTQIWTALENIWCPERSFIIEKLRTYSNIIKSRSGWRYSIKIVIQNHPQYYSKDDTFVYFRSLD